MAADNLMSFHTYTFEILYPVLDQESQNQDAFRRNMPRLVPSCYLCVLGAREDWGLG